MCQAHALWQSAASSAVPKLVEMPEHFAGSLVSLGVMSSPQLEVPLDRASQSRHTSTRFKGLNAKVFLRRCVLTLGGGHWRGSGQPCSSTHRSPLTAHRSPLTAQPSPPTRHPHSHPHPHSPTCRLPKSVVAELTTVELSAVKAAPYNAFLCPGQATPLERGVRHY